MRRLLFLGTLLLITSSCATEKLNLSPLSNTFSSDSKSVDSEDSKSISINITENVNASEITNLISTFPKFTNSAVNNEVITLKYTLQNYLYAIAAGNTSGKNKTIKNLEKSYKNIQKLRRYLKKDEDEVLNRYLVRLKTNVTVIEDSVNGKK
ncbi:MULTISPECIES: hypothetical protein [Chryseobacterium]|jgi:hypothetical protein|uniref:Lipoprotein n=1 Tax=Chryseobacterium indoltheticum TaxID=254 RepID=A0A381F7M4_9FLAO|nr:MULTISPECIES: hypothetical protein [Chryseobacterium]AZA61380.1 hypothetical protein EG340_10155 [Chryseobacterium indoltheticum]AZA72961.1 hypothetical protein EG358_03930 [Chryseobacterium indoltheticum]MDF2831047.1 hypothetical protein [Chryseobacterium indoltheticum]MDQ8142048.1 hypothetical protein [Chryseobacterium sp. CFS15]QQQ26626.1 hypothetical protein JJL46_10845 [Chryseobacterium indoltheticum]